MTETVTPTARRGIAGKLALAGGAVALAVAVFVIATPGCACIPPAKMARIRLKGDIRAVLEAQQRHFDSTGRYVTSLDSLDTRLPDPPVGLTFESYGDTAFRLRGDTGPVGATRCDVTVRQGVPTDLIAHCQEY